MSDPTAVVVKECNHWMRIAISLHLCVKQALLNILHDTTINGLPINEGQLFKRLKKFRTKEKDNPEIIINYLQWDKMCHYCKRNCPKECPRKNKTKSQDLDITCIVVLIINLTLLPPPLKKKQWKQSEPQAGDVREFVLLARKLRNDINHCSINQIDTEQKFKGYWDRVKTILVGLQFNDMSLFKDLKTTSLEPRITVQIEAVSDRCNYLLTKLKDCKEDVSLLKQKQGDDVNLLQKEIEKIQEQLKNLNQTDVNVKQMQDKMLTLLDNIEELKKELESAKARLKMLEDNDKKQDKKINANTENVEEVKKDMEKLKQNQSSHTEIFKDLQQLSDHLKAETKQKYDRISSTFKQASLQPLKSTERNAIVVNVSLIKDAEGAFALQSDIGQIETQREKLKTISSVEVKYKDIVTSSTDYIIISGVPGSGKTTLSETLCYLWSCNNIWNHKDTDSYFQFVFILYFRMINRFQGDPKVTAEKILSHFYPDHFNDTQQKKDNVLLILEGFDELSNKNNLLAKFDDQSSYSQSVSNLLDPNNKQLPFCRLVTSRPGSCSTLFKLLQSDYDKQKIRLFEVTGFSDENIKNYITKHFIEKEDLKKIAMRKFKKSPTLRTMMTIPFYCWTIYCLLDNDNISEEEIPFTYTSMFANLLTLFLRNHGIRNKKMSLKDVLTDPKIIQRILLLARFAHRLEADGKITFTKKEFSGDTNDFDDAVTQSGLIIKVERDNLDDPIYQFLHYSFHEFLVAVYMFHIGSKEIQENNYITSMIAGLLGGLLKESKSNPFVKRYANLFNGNNAIEITDIVNRVNFECVVRSTFEYQNQVEIQEKLIIKLTFDIAFQSLEFFIEGLKAKTFNLKSILIYNDSVCSIMNNITNSKKLLYKLYCALIDSCDSLSFFTPIADIDTFHEACSDCVVGLKNSFLVKKILLQFTNVFQSIHSIQSIAQYTETIEVYGHHGIFQDFDVNDKSFKATKLIYHIKECNGIKLEELSILVDMFKDVTFCFTSSQLFNEHHRIFVKLDDHVHVYDDHCIKSELIEFTKEFEIKAKQQEKLKNIKFGVSCLEGNSFSCDRALLYYISETNT